ncbi:MAG: TolB-like translocation protein, partial [Solirubrobacteraceae bacterium]
MRRPATGRAKAMEHLSPASARAHRASRWIAAVALGVAPILALLAGVAPASSLAAECKNEEIRVQQGSTFLPECRAWELVSPPAQPPTYTNEFRINRQLPQVGGATASEAGERVGYVSPYPNPGDQGDGEFFLATRGEAGWTVKDVVPPLSTGAGQEFECRPFVYFSQDLNRSALQTGVASANTAGGIVSPHQPCERDEPALVPGEPEGVSNVFVRDERTGATRLANLTPPGVTPENAVLEGVSPNLSHLVFEEAAPLVEHAPAGVDLYEWSEGALHLVTYTPAGAPGQGELAGGDPPKVANGHIVGMKVPGPVTAVTHSVSSDGERVLFTAGGGLYLRENASRAPTRSGECESSDPAGACTVEVDASQGASGAGGGGQFLYASADGARVFFLDTQRLTADATAVAGKPDLYEYDLERPEGERLKDLTANASEAADVLGYSGASEDGSYLYFVAVGALTGANREGAAPARGQPNLYVAHDGKLAFIATLSATSDGASWAADREELHLLTSAVSPDGEYLAFDSTRQLTGYDSEPAEAGACGSQTHCSELFVYSAADETLACASCTPGGRRPTGPSGLTRESFDGANNMLQYPQRRMFDDGQLFFESASGLVSPEGNGVPEVYEYRAGKVSLISGGGAEEAVLDAVSANAEDVFFVTSKSLVGADTGATASLYDARVEGGFAAQAPAGEVAGECEGAKACRAPLAEPPAEALGASSALSGPGNLVPAQAQAKQPPPGGHRHGGRPL